MASLVVTPQSALVDDPVTICIDGLHDRQAVTLVAVLKDEKVQMASYAHYIADTDGRVDVTRMESLGGTYDGIEPMGFIWSMELTDKDSGGRLMKRNVKEPIRIDVSFYNGHVTYDDIRESNCLASQQVERWYLSDDVDRIEVRTGRLVATMFVPKGDGPYPGILDLFGSIGGLVEYRASLLASHGFVTMALAYYWPPDKMITDMEYFKEALEFMWQHPKVLKTGLGAVGVSKGAEIVTLIAINHPKVKAVVNINVPPIEDLFPPTGRYEILEAEFSEEGLHVKLTEEAKRQLALGGEFNILPVDKSNAKFLTIHGSDDHNVPPVAGQMFTDRMHAVGRPNDSRILLYEGAGHLIEPPYSPLFRKSLHKLLNIFFVWGGQPKLHARAQEDSWQQIQKFLRETLTNLPQYPTCKL